MDKRVLKSIETIKKELLLADKTYFAELLNNFLVRSDDNEDDIKEFVKEYRNIHTSELSHDEFEECERILFEKLKK